MRSSDWSSDVCSSDLPKVTTVRRPWIKDGLALFPWEWSRTALDQVEKLYNNGRVEVAIGHWDLQSFGGDDSHICPTAALKAKFGDGLTIYSGHYPLPGEYEVDGHTVVCPGSMDHYSHAQAPSGALSVPLPDRKSDVS